MSAPQKPAPVKTCTGCGQDKPRDDFYLHPTGADNRMSKCKTCCIEADRVRTAKRRLAGTNNSWSTPAEYSKRSVIPSFKYQPLELKPAPVRPGADDALKLPSRVGKNLYYRNGSATNL